MGTPSRSAVVGNDLAVVVANSAGTNPKKEEHAKGTVGHLLVTTNDKYTTTEKRVARRKILDEEEYNEGIDAIIEREFFPQVGRLRAENEYLDAKAENDVIGMRTIARKAAMARTLEGTPAASPHIRTPGALPSVTPSLLGGRGNETPGVSGTQYFSGQEASQSEGPRVKASTGLNEFLRTHASEDNAEFEVLMAKQREANKQKYAWLHAVEAKSEEKRLAITAAQDENLGVVKTIEAARDNSTNGALIGWDYKNKNSLMYFPDGTNQSVSTLDSVKAASKQVVVANTRLRENPFKKPADVKKKPSTSLFGVGTVLGSISIAGHEKVAPSPEVRGYGFIGTPVPRPGEGDGLGGVGLAGDESPMMTWGSIEDTPFRIETEATPGPQFHMHPEPPREKLLNKVSKQMAQRKANRTPKPTHLAAHTPSSLRNSATPYGNLSPAARLLMDRTLDKKTIGAPSKLGRGTPKASRGTGIGTGKFGSFGDGALRQAYASPAHTVVAGSRKRTHSTSQRSGATPSITDGLLDSTPQAKYTR